MYQIKLFLVLFIDTILKVVNELEFNGLLILDKDVGIS